ncbi:hypothetical protein PanWU01x14_119930 [Parasponia andersonii]|uniref:Uncharacterized protein n=1 Tax=Parasponia andersonii TaxID=3476 RepID=A0A2P5CVQ0_PARAD|nr:hypothetical protein PanWU01x14_119930 [Parasponia andersonii]
MAAIQNMEEKTIQFLMPNLEVHIPYYPHVRHTMRLPIFWNHDLMDKRKTYWKKIRESPVKQPLKVILEEDEENNTTAEASIVTNPTIQNHLPNHMKKKRESDVPQTLSKV